MGNEAPGLGPVRTTGSLPRLPENQPRPLVVSTTAAPGLDSRPSTGAARGTDLDTRDHTQVNQDLRRGGDFDPNQLAGIAPESSPEELDPLSLLSTGLYSDSQEGRSKLPSGSTELSLLPGVGGRTVSSMTPADRLKVLEHITQQDLDPTTLTDNDRCSAASLTAASWYSGGAKGLQQHVDAVFSYADQKGIPYLADPSGKLAVSFGTQDRLYAYERPHPGLSDSGPVPADSDRGFGKNTDGSTKTGPSRVNTPTSVKVPSNDGVMIAVPGISLSHNQLQTPASQPTTAGQLDPGATATADPALTTYSTSTAHLLDLNALAAVRTKLQDHPNLLTVQDMWHVQDGTFQVLNSASNDVKNQKASGVGSLSDRVRDDFVTSQGLDKLYDGKAQPVAMKGHALLKITPTEAPTAFYDSTHRGDTVDQTGAVLDSGQVSTHPKVVAAYQALVDEHDQVMAAIPDFRRDAIPGPIPDVRPAQPTVPTETGRGTPTAKPPEPQASTAPASPAKTTDTPSSGP
ncbi:MAG: hypothetical protein ACAI44_40250 [Candidatus Sericytochromatia bacterium]